MGKESAAAALEKPLFGSVKRGSIQSILLCIAIGCLINIAIACLFRCFGQIQFEMNDDLVIQNLLNGSLGDYYVYNVQSNIALNEMLAGLYKWSGAVNWYGVFLFVMLVFSCGIVGGVLIDKLGIKIGVCLYLLTTVIFFGFLIYHFTWTSVSYAMMTAGLVCLVYGFSIQGKALRMLLYVLSVVLLVLSAFLRKETVATSLVYAASLLVLLLIKYKKRALGAVLVVGIAFSVIGGFEALDNAYYNSTEELREFKRFNAIRATLSDRMQMSYEEDGAVLAQYGWDVADLGAYQGFVYPDDSKFDADVQEQIYDALSYKKYNTNVPSLIGELRIMFYYEYLPLTLCLAVFFLLAFFSQKRKLFKLYTVFLFAVPFLFHIFFAFVWRAVFRVVVPHYILSAMLLLLFIDPQYYQSMLARSGRRVTSVAAAVMVGVAAVGLCGRLVSFSEVRAIWQGDPYRAANQELIEYMHENDGKAYVYGMSSMNLINNVLYTSIFDTYPKDYSINFRLIGSWDVRSPSYNDFKARYGLSNLPDDLLDNDDVYLVIPDDRIYYYLLNKYGRDIEYEEVVRINDQYAIGKMVFKD